MVCGRGVARDAGGVGRLEERGEGEEEEERNFWPHGDRRREHGGQWKKGMVFELKDREGIEGNVE